MLVDNAREVRRATFPVWIYVAIPLAALLVQVYLPLFETLREAGRIDLPLLVTIYFAIMRRSQLEGLAIGVLPGLAQDSLFHQRLGMFGISKTLVGYFAASIGMQFDTEYALVRMILCAFFYVFHQFFYWVLERSLLDQPAVFAFRTELILAVIHGVVGVIPVSLSRPAAAPRITA